MTDFEIIQSYTPSDNFYSVDDKLYLHILKRSEKAFDRADRRRDRVKTLEEFEKYRKRALKSFLKSVGKIPYDKKLPLNARTVSVTRDEGLVIENIVFQSREGVYVPANLYLPEKREGKIPAVLFQGGHDSRGRFTPRYQSVCRTIAKAGIAVLFIDHIGQGERNSYPEIYPVIDSPCYEHERVGRQCLMAGSNVLKYFISDARRALDYIETRPEIDSDKIGATGNSGGGTTTAVISIMDERIKASAPGTFITSRREYFYAGSTQDAEQVWEGVTRDLFDHYELVAAFCPKPYIILGVKSDFFCPEGAVNVYERIKEFYTLYGKENLFRIAWDDSRHSYTDSLAVVAAEFFAEVLAGKKVKGEKSGYYEDASKLCVSKSGNINELYPNAPIVFDENLKSLSKMPPYKNGGKKLLDKINFERVPAKNYGVRYLSERTLDSIESRCIMWFTQKDIPCYGVLFSKEGTDTRPVTLCLWEGGTNELVSHEDFIRKTVLEKGRVLVADLTGMGKCTPRNCLYHIGSFDTPVRLAKELLFLGDSLPALMSYDLLQSIEMVKESLDSKEVLLYTEEKFCIFADIIKKIGTDVELSTKNPVSANDLVSDKLYSEKDVNLVTLPDIVRLLGE